MNAENYINMTDGRRLCYAEFGRPDGFPVFYFHGSPSSRLEPLLIGDEVLTAEGLRVISPDRPGIGRSDPQPGRGFSDWPKDVIEMADALRIDQFSILGYSGGAGYAAVCAARISQRLHSVVIVSGGWRMDVPEVKSNQPLPFRIFFTMAKRAPFLLRLMLRMMKGSGEVDEQKELRQLKQRVPPADFAAFSRPGRVTALHEAIREGMYQGTEGISWDLQLYVRAFDFSLDEVRMPLTFFHGAQDANFPLPAIRQVVSGVPGAELIIYEDEAHFSTLCNHFPEITSALVKR